MLVVLHLVVDGFLSFPTLFVQFLSTLFVDSRTKHSAQHSKSLIFSILNQINSWTIPIELECHLELVAESS